MAVFVVVAVVFAAVVGCDLVSVVDALVGGGAGIDGVFFLPGLVEIPCVFLFLVRWRCSCSAHVLLC